MGGMDNKTSISLTKAKQNSRKFHAKNNAKLYEEYLVSGKQYSQTFLEWKKLNSKRR